MVKGELNPKIKFALFKRTLNIPEQVIFLFLIPLLRFWDISVSSICKLHILGRLRGMLYRRRLYILAFITLNHFKMYKYGAAGETHSHNYFEVISFYNSKDITFSDMSLHVTYVICVFCMS